jgi:hypothetical protein
MKFQGMGSHWEGKSLNNGWRNPSPKISTLRITTFATRGLKEQFSWFLDMIDPQPWRRLQGPFSIADMAEED